MIKLHYKAKTDESVNQFRSRTNSRKNFSVLCGVKLYLRRIFSSGDKWIYLQKIVTLHFFVKNVTLRFFSILYCEFLQNGVLLRAEIFTTYRTFCFVSTVKISAKSNKPLLI